MRVIIIFFALLFSSLSQAFDTRNLLQKMAGQQQVKEQLLPKSEWIKYPAYYNRAAWDKLTGVNKLSLIAAGDALLNYSWKIVNASDYLAFEQSGSRLAMENPFGANNNALSHLVFAELAEGKGRFLPQIIDGIWHTLNMSSWVLSAHLIAQKSHRSLPDFNEQIIDLTSGDMGSFLSWTWYFFNQDFDKINPIISQRIKATIKERILTPYLQRSDYWWQALGNTPRMVNNWNPWCNANVLACFLLLEDDKNQLATAVYKTMVSVDQFINYTKQDGACEEGPSYWGHAAGKLFDYLQLLSNASNGKLNIFNEPQLKNMGEYIARSYVGNGWVVNFADASAKGGGNAGLVYRYGQAVNSTDMQGFAAYLENMKEEKTSINEGRDFFRTLENIASYNALKQTSPALPTANYSWYPQTEFCYIKNRNGFFFAAKAGYNNESHNHNDVGTFNLYLNEVPLFIDAGVGTYNRQTFSSERYSIWTMQSNYHNLPMVNGMPQQFGAQYKATDVFFDEKKNLFSANIATAYGKDAAVKHWLRSYTLNNNGLNIEDAFELSKTIVANQINFLTWAKPEILGNGLVKLAHENEAVEMRYNAKIFDASVETIPQTDQRLIKVWGNQIYRLTLTAKKQSLKGRYKYTISKIGG